MIVFLSGLSFSEQQRGQPFARICDNFLDAMESNKRQVNKKIVIHISVSD